MLNIEKVKNEIKEKARTYYDENCNLPHESIGMAILKTVPNFKPTQNNMEDVIDWLCKETKLTNKDKYPNTFVETLFDPDKNMYMARVVDMIGRKVLQYLVGDQLNDGNYKTLAEIDEAYQEWLNQEVEEDYA